MNTPKNALVKLAQLSVGELAEVWLMLETLIRPHLVSDISSYAPGRQRIWIPYEAPLDTPKSYNRPFAPGVLAPEVWEFIVQTCLKYDFRPDTAIVSLGGKINPHRDTTYAAEWAMGINLGVCNWHIASDRERARPDYSMALSGGEVFKFNTKHVHAVTDSAPDRWAINVWQIADTKAARDYKVRERLESMLEANPKVREFINGTPAQQTPKEEKVSNKITSDPAIGVIQFLAQVPNEGEVLYILNDFSLVHPGMEKAYQEAASGNRVAEWAPRMHLMPINTGKYYYPYLERLNHRGVKFAISRISLDWADQSMVDGATLAFVDADALTTIHVKGHVPSGKGPAPEFDWSLIGLEVKDSKKMAKRLAELTRLVKASTAKTLRVSVISPEMKSDNPDFWVKAMDGKNAIRMGALPKTIQKDLERAGHQHVMGRGWCKISTGPTLVKGDFAVIEDSEWPWVDVDVVAHAENCKGEVVLAGNQKDLWTFWQHAPLHVTTWDQQTMRNYPWMFPVSRMRDDYMAEMSSIDESLANGILPNEKVEGDNVHEVKILPESDEVAKRRDLAKLLRDAGLSPKVFENLVGMDVMGFAESKAKYFHRQEWKTEDTPDPMYGLHDKHAVVMRNSFRGTCITDTFLKHFARVPYSSNRIARFDARWGIVWNGEHFARSFELHGTHDNDDSHFIVPLMIWSSNQSTVDALKRHGVMLDGLQVPSDEVEAKMVVAVFRLPNGAGEYSIMEFDFATWPEQIPFDPQLVQTVDLNFAKGWPKPQPMVMPANVPGLPTSRVYSKAPYLRADIRTDLSAQFQNPGFGQMCNALLAYSMITGGKIPACMTDSLGNIVDATQQGADIVSFSAIKKLLGDIEAEVLKISKKKKIKMDNYWYHRRGAVLKSAVKAGYVSWIDTGIKEFDTEYGTTYRQLKADINMKYGFFMRRGEKVVQQVMGLKFTDTQMKWAKDFILKMEKDLADAANVPGPMWGHKFAKVVHQNLLRTRRHAVIDAAIEKLESLRDTDAAVLCIWHAILEPNFVDAKAKYGHRDRIMVAMGSERSIANLALQALINKGVIN